MRTAITLGFDKDGNATIISQPSVSIHAQRAGFKQLASEKGKFEEIQLWESGRGIRRSKRFGNKGTVNFNAAHLVEKQQDKKAAKNLPDLTPEEGEQGGVNFNASHPVEKQQDKKAAKKLEDLTPDASPARTKKEGVNFDASIPVDEQGKRSHAKKSAKSQKRGNTKTSPETEPDSSKTESTGSGEPDEAGGPSL